jgi:uncharacterized protein YabN with tetrapyrrole methylase and pyrophosphatase domain
VKRQEKKTLKFIDRFRFIETAAGAADKSIERLTPPEMDVLWEKAKPYVLASADHS